MVSHDNIGFYLLAREVAKHVKVVQSGQGADEVFGGYHWYPPMLSSTAPAEDYGRVFFDRGHEEYRAAVHPRFHGGDHASAFVERQDRKSVVSGQSVSVRVELGGRRIIQNNTGLNPSTHRPIDAHNQHAH